MKSVGEATCDALKEAFVTVESLRCDWESDGVA